MASQIDCATASAYANLRNPWHNIVALLHVSPRDPNPNRTLGASRLGASAGLCTLFTVTAISSPFSRMSFMFVPIGIPMWVLWGGEVAWEGYSFYNNVDDGIGRGAFSRTSGRCYFMACSSEMDELWKAVSAG
jgi:hypothetical protein